MASIFVPVETKETDVVGIEEKGEFIAAVGKSEYDHSDRPKKSYTPSYARYSCMDVCGQEKPCGNTFCSNNPHYHTANAKRAKQKKDR